MRKEMEGRIDEENTLRAEIMEKDIQIEEMQEE